MSFLRYLSAVENHLQDLLIPPGQTLADLTARDADQVQQLNAAAAAARAEAVAAITGQSVAVDVAAGKRSVGKLQGVSAAAGDEIEPAVEDAAPRASLAGGFWLVALPSFGTLQKAGAAFVHTLRITI